MTNWQFEFRAADVQNFRDLQSGIKKIETRAATPKYRKIAIGDTVTIKCGGESFTKTVRTVHHWDSIDAMVREIPFTDIMPHVASVDEMKQVYASYPNYTEKIREYGLLGFMFS